MNVLVTLASLATLGQALVVPQADLDLSLDLEIRDDCSNISCVASAGAAHIIVTRASTEDPGTGVLSSVADAIVSACPGSDVDSNPYPALLDPYVESETQGLGNLTEMVTTYKSCCPDSKMVLLGYSQGAQVTADFLCGRSEDGFSSTEAYASEVADELAAVVIMADPSFVKGQVWDRGNASNVSYFPRQDNSACDPVADKMISYCDAGDYFCDNGTSSDAVAIHQGYVTEYGDEAADYVVGKIGGCSS